MNQEHFKWQKFSFRQLCPYGKPWSSVWDSGEGALSRWVCFCLLDPAWRLWVKSWLFINKTTVFLSLYLFLCLSTSDSKSKSTVIPISNVWFHMSVQQSACWDLLFTIRYTIRVSIFPYSITVFFKQQRYWIFKNWKLDIFWLL